MRTMRKSMFFLVCFLQWGISNAKSFRCVNNTGEGELCKVSVYPVDGLNPLVYTSIRLFTFNRELLWGYIDDIIPWYNSVLPGKKDAFGCKEAELLSSLAEMSDNSHNLKITTSSGLGGGTHDYFGHSDLEIDDLKEGRELGIPTKAHRRVIAFGAVLVLILAIVTFRLWKVQQNLQRSKAEVVEQNQRLIQLDEKRKGLMSMLGHDLRGPLWAIRQYLEGVISGDVEANKISQFGEYALLSLVNIQGEMEELLDWAKESHEFEIYPSELNMKELVNAVFKGGKLSAIHKNVELVNEVDPDVMIYSDLRIVTMIIRNLVHNSIKFTQDGWVKVSSKKEDNNWMFYIQDSGVGATDEDIHGMNSSLKVKRNVGTNGEIGEGMGIKCVHKYAEILGADVVFSSKGGVGLTVELRNLDVPSEGST